MKLYFFEKAKRLRIVLFLFLQIIVIFMTKEWWQTAILKEGELSFYNTDYESISIEKDTVLNQQFTCVGEGLTQIDFFLLKSEKGKGTVEFFVRNEKGEIVSIPYIYDLSLFEMEELRFPVYMIEALKNGEEYDVEIKIEGVEKTTDLEIKVCENSLYASVLENASVYGKNLMAIYYYDMFYDVYDAREVFLAWIILNSWLLITIEVEPRWSKLAMEVLLFLATIAGYLIFEVLNMGAGSWGIIRFLINGIPIYICLKFIYELTGWVKLSVILTDGFCLFGSIVNYYVTIFRGTPILPWDLKSFRTALSVAESYSFQCTKPLIISIFIMIIASYSFGLDIKKESCRGRKCSVKRWAVIGAVFLAYICLIMPNISKSLWNVKEVYDSQGVVASFLSYAGLLGADKPKGYSDSKAEELMDEVLLEEENEGISAENVIVIMNESFADLRVINTQMIQDIMGDSFIDTLNEDVVKGWLYVPTYGANTANTEYEVLTGASMTFHVGVPYQMMSSGKYETLATSFSKQGFYSEAFHPMSGANWNRNKVYPQFGFDEFLAAESMSIEGEDMLRWCMSDKADYDIIIEEYEKKSENKFFMFNVTVQNHGGYLEEYDNFDATIDLTEYGDFPEAENYLSLIKESEKSIEELLKYFSAVNEPTVICFFGDHQPTLGDGFYEKMYGQSIKDLSPKEKQKMYITPFFVWANYDIQEQTIERMSAFYLGPLILKTANCKMDKYQSYLWQLFNRYPVIQNGATWDAEGNFYDSEKMKNLPELKNYSYLQYYRMK